MRFLVLAFAIVSTSAVRVRADYPIVGNVNLGPNIYSFNDGQGITQLFAIEGSRVTSRVDFLLGGNGVGTVHAEVFELIGNESIVSRGAQTFSMPSTAFLPTGALLFSVPFHVDIAEGDRPNFQLRLTVDGGTAFVAHAINSFQLHGGTGLSKITTLPITDINQGNTLIIPPNIGFSVNYLVYAAGVPEPSALLCAATAWAPLAWARCRRA